MKAERLAAAIAIFTFTWMLGAGAASAQDQSVSKKSGVRVWAYVGPGAPLANAKVQVKDAKGRLVAQGRTNGRGTYSALSFRHSPKLPLSITTSSGRAAGKAFSGHMRARAFSTRLSSQVVQTSLVSTAASKLARGSSSYSRMTSRVRSTLGIGKGSLPEVLRIRNDDVGYQQLIRAFAKTRGGFDSYARKVADLASKSKKIGGLRPKSAALSGADPGSRARAARSGTGAPGRAAQGSTTPDTTVCSVAVPSQGSSGDTSTEIISDIAAIGIGGLLKYAGAPSAASQVITGMLLAPIGENPEATVLQEDANAVANDLDCLDAQVNYLSSQIGEVQLTIDVDTATNCSNAITPAWQNYEYAVNNASQYPLNSSNTSLTGTGGYLDTWNQANTTCGSAINSMLFGTAGGQGAAWQQLNQNTSAGVKWYTQEQVQDLQTFLSYWGTILYEQFILANEYFNYYGQFEEAQSYAGGSNATGTSPVCDAGSTAMNTATFCVWQNNIAAAYPGDIYSDEIGVISSGQSVAAVPGGMVAPAQPAAGSPNGIYAQPATNQPQFSPTAMNLQWWYDYFLNFITVKSCGNDPQCPGYNSELQIQMDGGPVECIEGGMGCPPASTPSTNWAQTTIDWFNGLGMNPKSYGTAVETYDNPQNVARSTAASSDVSDLSTAGPDAQSAESVLYNAINQTPDNGTPAWGSLSASQPTYMADDSSPGTSAITVQMQAVWLNFYINFWIYAPLGNTAAVKANWFDNNIPATTVTAFLMKRNWWPGAAEATTYEPPPPPTG